jgi:N-acetylneuraminate synthase
MEPNEFTEFCKIIKDIWCIQNYTVDKNDLKKYSSMKKVFEKSIISKKFIKKGSSIKLGDLNFKKPGDGIRADQYKKIIGKITKRNIKINKKIKYSDFD